MSENESVFIDGLLWYLETRNWALQKIRTCPHGSQLLDIKMYHYLYFSNLFSAVEIVRDYSKTIGETVDFEEKIRLGFENADDYQYARELRNAMIHRGLDPAAGAHSDNSFLFILCPQTVQDRSGRNSYSSTFKYTIQLADCCNQIVNDAILEFVDSHGFLVPSKFVFRQEDTLKAIQENTVMPDWAKSMAAKAFEAIDCQQLATTTATTRVKHLKELLGQS